MLSFELTILDWIQTNLRNPIMDLLVPAITTLGNSGLIWIILAGILILMPKYRKVGAAVMAGLVLEVVCCNLVLRIRLSSFSFPDRTTSPSRPDTPGPPLPPFLFFIQAEISSGYRP